MLIYLCPLSPLACSLEVLRQCCLYWEERLRTKPNTIVFYCHLYWKLDVMDLSQVFKIKYGIYKKTGKLNMESTRKSFFVCVGRAKDGIKLHIYIFLIALAICCVWSDFKWKRKIYALTNCSWIHLKFQASRGVFISYLLLPSSGKRLVSSTDVILQRLN